MTRNLSSKRGTNKPPESALVAPGHDDHFCVTRLCQTEELDGWSPQADFKLPLNAQWVKHTNTLSFRKVLLDI